MKEAIIAASVRTNGKFKQTEVGLIPEDWMAFTFTDVITGFSSGQTPYRAIKEYYKGTIPWITSGELKYNIITETLESITKTAVDNTNLKILPKGTFLIAITGLEAAGTRGSCAITGIEATTNQSCMALYPVKDKLLTAYLYHYYVMYGDFLAFRYCQGTKQQSYTAAIAKKLPISIPPSLSEQTAIAQALSDADALIASLEKLIEKKKRIKQGAMQELLSSTDANGKPKEGWVKKRLGDLGITYGGLSGKSKSDFSNGNSKYIQFMNIMSNAIIDTTNLPTVKIHKGEKQNAALKGDLFFNGSSETPEEVGMCALLVDDVPELYLNSFCFGFRPFQTNLIDGLFLANYFRSSYGRAFFYSSAQGATRYNLSKSNFLKLELSIPPIETQRVVATTIKEIDEEVSILSKKLAKTLSMKQGMMQNLLTGKIRLV